MQHKQLPTRPPSPLDDSILGSSPTGTDSGFSIVDNLPSEKGPEHPGSEYQQLSCASAQKDGGIEAHNGIHPTHIRTSHGRRRWSKSK